MDVQVVSFVATAANLAAMALAGGALLLVAWQPRRDRASGSLAVFLGAVIVWSLATLLLGNPAVLTLQPVPRFYLLVGALALAAVAFFAFAVDFCAVPARWARWLWRGNPVVLAVLLVLLLAGHLFTDIDAPALYTWEYQILPLGWAAVAYIVALYVAAFFSAHAAEDAARGRPVEYAALLMIAGQLTNAAPPLAALNLDALAATGAVALIGRAILRARYLTPLAEVGHQLRVANQDWRQALVELSAARERNQALEDALSAASGYKSAFLANMSHELRTPLNSIVGYSELLTQGFYGALNERQADRLEKINRNGLNLLALINDILDLSRIEAGRLDLNPSRIELAPFVQQIASDIGPQCAAKGLTLTVDAPETLPALRADERRIRQVLGNLLSNAVKFTREGGVTLRVRETRVANGRSDAVALPVLGWLNDGNWVVFSVTDTGIGIAPEDQAAIFDEFQQLDSDATRDLQGTGLGLAITKKLVELHNGRIWLKSALEQGSTFFVALPAEARVRAPAAPSGSADGAHGTALVIADDPDAAARLVADLDRAGYGVLVAHDGAAGVEMAGQRRPSAIMVDVTMPGMNGWQAIAALRADPASANTPLIAVAVAGGAPVGLALGAIDCITKPVQHVALRDALRRTPPAASHEPILVVEGNPDDRDILNTCLAAERLHEQAFASGAEAIAWLAQRRAALVIVDLVSGVEVLAHVRGQPQHRETPVIVVATHALTPEEEDALNARVVDALTQARAPLRDLLAHASRPQPMSSGEGSL
ncbi:MAG: ATP-binding protein [Anaerolineae bacterium]|nr:ATP-binding protein [Anaerolineae bacterium]